MNRLTHEIGLVLISSAMILPGCYGHQPPRAELPKAKGRLLAEQEESGTNTGGGDFDTVTDPSGNTTTAAGARSSTSHSPIRHGGHIPIFIPLGGRSHGTAASPATSSGLRAGPATSSGARSTTRSSVGSSARGGFGSTGHGVSA